MGHVSQMIVCSAGPVDLSNDMKVLVNGLRAPANDMTVDGHHNDMMVDAPVKRLIPPEPPVGLVLDF